MYHLKLCLLPTIRKEEIGNLTKYNKGDIVMKVDVEVDIDLILKDSDQVIINLLRKEYKNKLENIQSLENLAFMSGIRLHKVQDLVDDRKLLKALNRVLKYYSTYDEHKEFLEEVRGDAVENRSLDDRETV